MAKKRRINKNELLRAFGFTVASRPREGPNRWERNGKECDEDVALAIVRRDSRAVTEEADPDEAADFG